MTLDISWRKIYQVIFFTKFQKLSCREFTVRVGLAREIDCYLYEDKTFIMYFNDGNIKELDISSDNIHDEVYEVVYNYLFK